MSAALTPHTPTPRQHLLGVLCAILVAIMWVVSAELVQVAMGSRSQDSNAEKFEHPYFVTYVSLSAFSALLFGFFRKSWQRILKLPPRGSDGFITLQDMGAEGFEDDREGQETKIEMFNARQVLGIALIIAPLFFLSDWVYTVGLQMTSVSSSSTISSLTGLFTLAIGALIGVERFSFSKLFAAVVTIVGVTIIGAYDGKSEGKISVIGDGVNVAAAVIYAVYTTVLKAKMGPPGALDVSMLFGIIGAVVAVGATPGFLLFHFTGWEKFELPTGRAAMILFVNAWIGTVLSDFLWAKSIALTTPLIGTLALSLTVPLSIILDYCFRGVKFTFQYLIGVAFVFAGFLMVNVDEALERRNARLIEQDEEDNGG